MEMTPQATQTTRQSPIDCVSRKTPFGEMKIPEPIVVHSLNEAIFYIKTMRITNDTSNDKTNAGEKSHVSF